MSHKETFDELRDDDDPVIATIAETFYQKLESMEEANS